jgi:cytochrome c peroxidase
LASFSPSLIRWAWPVLCSLFVWACDRGPKTITPAHARTTGFESSLATSAAITPLPPTVEMDANRVLLGRKLFNDPRLSRNDTVSCASCHSVSDGGDDGLSVPVGIDGAVGELNTPTVLNSRFNFAQFWDGRAATLEEQLPQPIHNPKEMDSDLPQVLAKLARDPVIVAEFQRAYADGLTTPNIVDAIVAYETALTTPNSPFDRFLNGDTAALSESAHHGYDLFVRLGCVSCHQGRNIGGNMFQHLGIMGDYFADRGNVTEADYGRFNVTGRERDKFKFKVPSLRNVARTAPYFHDGSAATLEDCVRVMSRYQLGRPLDAEQVNALVAFLESLSGDVDPALL